MLGISDNGENPIARVPENAAEAAVGNVKLAIRANGNSHHEGRERPALPVVRCAEHGRDEAVAIDPADPVVTLGEENVPRFVDGNPLRKGEQRLLTLSIPGTGVVDISIGASGRTRDRRNLAIGGEAPNKVVHGIGDEQVALVVEGQRTGLAELRFGGRPIAEAAPTLLLG